MGDLKTVRVWFTDPDLSPNGDVWYHNLDDVVKLIVPLPYQCGHKKLADLAVDKDGVERVRRQYEAVTFQQLGSRDPMVLAQEPEHLTLKRFEAYKQLRDTYLACQVENNSDDQVRTWLEGRLQWIAEGLNNLRNSVQTVRIWYPICQGPLMRDAKDKGIGGMILAEVQLEDPSNGYAPARPSHRPAGTMLVDLAVLPEHSSTVCSIYLPVNFAPFSDHDPLVCSQPGDNMDLKRALACRKVLFNYYKAQRIRQSQVQLPELEENELISTWFSRCMGLLEGFVKAIHGFETIRVWCCSDQERPMDSVRSKCLHDVVKAAVPLQDPNYQRVPDDKTVHPEGAILVDLAVSEEGVDRVLLKYGPVSFDAMGDEDPVVVAQQGKNTKDKRIAAYKDMLERYSRYLREECCLLGPMAKVWVVERLAGIENQLSVLHPNSLETIRIRCPKYQSHPWEIILERGLGDVVREAIPLEDEMSSQESVQVDLAVEPSGISRVRRLCELVEFQRLSEDDPIIQMQPDGNPLRKKFNACNHALRRYTEARALRQIDGALMLWYEKEIVDLESHIGDLGMSSF